MRNLNYILLLVILISSNCYSQLPEDYPFKTLLDDQNNLLITGYDLNNDFFVTKYPPVGSNFLWTNYYSNPGNDRGMDIIQYIDSTFGTQYIYATGYIFNQVSMSNDIFLIKFDGAGGNILWTKVYRKKGDDKAYGIALDADRNVYLTGYTTSKENGLDMITLKYGSDSSLKWTNFYNNNQFNGDDVGTHLLIDDNYLYVSGSTYDGPTYGNDISMITYSLDSNISYVQNYKKKGKQIPTSFVISEVSRIHTAKSRVALGSITDNVINPTQTDFLTLLYDNDLKSTVLWTRTFNGAGNGNDIPTAIGADLTGNVYVTGYSYNGTSSQYDFATMKYYSVTGQDLWTPGVKYYDTLGGNDKASSIKISSDGNVYVAGISDSTSNKYKISVYKQDNDIIKIKWRSDFMPTFGEKDINNVNKNRASKVEIDNLGNVIVIAFEWDDNSANYAIWKYDSQGNILYTIDNTGNSPGGNPKSEKNPLPLKRKKQEMETKD